MTKRNKKSLDERVAAAVRLFWRTRSSQGRRQGAATGRPDSGNRAVATGGKQLDGFNQLMSELLEEADIPVQSILRTSRKDVTLPGFFRPTKQWDLLVVHEGSLLGVLECKALCGPSFGNNYNNRIEEAIGSATDIWTAFREGRFSPSPKPFVGYLLIVEEAAGSTRPVTVMEKHFAVYPEFAQASYLRRCEESVRRLVHERCYDAGCLIVTNKTRGKRGEYAEPATDLTFARFSQLMCGQIATLYRATT